jgi:hypothetical protein
LGGAGIGVSAETYGINYFDAWNEGNAQVAWMNLPRWYNRTPYFGELTNTSPYAMTIFDNKQPVVDMDIAYAAHYGVDYFAFYSTAGLGSQAEQCFLTSTKKSLLKFCMIKGWFGDGGSPPAPYFTGAGGTRVEADEIAFLVTRMQDAQHFSVLGSRPLFYWYTTSSRNRTPAGVFGSDAAALAFFNGLRAAAQSAGLGNPYIVVQHSDVNTAKTYATAIGGDAITTYAVTGNSYADVMSAAQAYWSAAKTAGAKLVPPLASGWGGPWVQSYGGGTSAMWDDAGQPSMYQFKKQLEDAKAYIANNGTTCDAGTLLIYNWSEYGEGGWMNADKGNGPGKLEVLRHVKNGTAAPLRWDFTFTQELWTAGNISGLVLSSRETNEGRRYLEGTMAGDDPMLMSADNLGINLTGLSHVVVRLSNRTPLTNGKVYFQTVASPTFVGNSVAFTMVSNDPGYTDYYVDMRGDPEWTGILKQLRLDPGDFRSPVTPVSGSFSLDWIRLEPTPSMPGDATCPYPADKSVNVGPFIDLAWIPGDRAIQSVVYFGTSSNALGVGNTVGSSFNLPELRANTTYYWRIDSQNSTHVNQGPVWTFTTGDIGATQALLRVHTETNGAGLFTYTFTSSAGDPYRWGIPPDGTIVLQSHCVQSIEVSDGWTYTLAPSGKITLKPTNGVRFLENSNLTVRVQSAVRAVTTYANESSSLFAPGWSGGGAYDMNHVSMGSGFEAFAHLGPEPHPAFAAMGVDTQRVSVALQELFGATCFVDWTSNLVAAEWITLTNIVALGGSTNIVFERPEAADREAYFRLRFRK